jgi:predicted aldo/keto reductase-like oxidoreductase
MGVTAMKVFAQEKLVGGAPIETLIRYALSLPVAAAVLGMPKLEFIDENTRIAKNFKALDKREMRDLSDRLSKQYKAGLDRYFQNHVDA